MSASHQPDDNDSHSDVPHPPCGRSCAGVPGVPGRAHHSSTPQPVTSRTGYLLHSTWGTRTRSGPLGYVSLMGCAFTSPCPLGRGGDNGSHETCPCLMVSFTRLRRCSRREVSVKLWAIAKLTPSKFHTYLLPTRQGDYGVPMSHQPHPRGEPHHIHTRTRGMDAMFSPLDFPEPLEEPRRREGRFSFFLLHVPPSLGHRGAILGFISQESPHPRMGPSSAHYLSNAHIPVPLLTVVSQSGEQTPPPAHAGHLIALCLKTVRPTCAKQESACRGDTATSSDDAAVRGGCHVWSRRRFFAVGQDIDLPTRPVLSKTHVMCRASLVPIVCLSPATHA